jgi:hypothetical protein
MPIFRPPQGRLMPLIQSGCDLLITTGDSLTNLRTL